MIRKIFFMLLVLLLLSPLAFAKAVRVKSTVTKKGVYRQSHYRTSPNKSKSDNWSTKGNINPYTGNKGTKNP